MAEHQFRVTVEDLVEGTKRVMEFAPGDYLLIPFAPCHRAGVQVYPKSGTHVITVKDYWPEAPARDAAAREDVSTP